MTPTYTKDPDAKLDYGFDWSDWLATAETISSVSWTVASGLTEDATKRTNTGTVVSTMVSGGTAGTTYSVAAKITTSAVRIDERTLNVRVVNR